MGLLTLPTSASPSAPAPGAAPQGAKKSLIMIGKDALAMLLSLVNDVRASRTCKEFHCVTKALIERKWSSIRLQNFPHLKRLFSEPPTNCIQLSAAVTTMKGQYAHIEDGLRRLRPSFLPGAFEKSIQAESDRNLALIWPRIARALALPPNPMNVAEIKNWLSTNAARLAIIQRLDLDRLGLTMIPDEIASLALPNLITLTLNDNNLRFLPANFGANWNQLFSLWLSNNQLRSLPDGFGANWNQLQNLWISYSQLNALPDGFGANWNQLQYLGLSNNQLRSLPNGFGANWNQLQYLGLSYNQLNALPNGFRANWPSMNHRFECLKGNPILQLASPFSQPEPPKALLSPFAVHILSTVALAAIATYAIGWKIPAAVGAVYLGHQYMRGDLWAL